MADPQAQVDGNYGMGQRTDDGINGRGAPEGLYPGMRIPGPGYHQPGKVFEGVPDDRQRKMALQPFDGKELCHGLGSEFIKWGKAFVRQVGFSERVYGFVWPEDIKVDVAGQHLAGIAQKYHCRQLETWWYESQTLEHAKQRLLQTFTTKITPAQSMKLFIASKSSQCSWTKHLLYLTAVSDACEGAESLVFDSFVHYADTTMRKTILSRLDLNRVDYPRKAEELAQFSQSTELAIPVKHFGRDVVNVVESTNVIRIRNFGKVKKRLKARVAKRCYQCGNTGHLKAACPKKGKKRQDEDVILKLAMDGPAQPEMGFWTAAQEDIWSMT